MRDLISGFTQAAHTRTHALAKPALAVPAVNVGLTAMQLLVNVFQLFILPLWLLSRSFWWGAALVPLAAMTNPFWSLIHEAIHDLFSSSSQLNTAVGRVLSIFFGAPFHVLRWTHLSHHKFNRSPMEKGTELYDAATTSRTKAALGYYGYIFCGVYLLEVSSIAVFFLPGPIFGNMRRRVAATGNTQERWLAKKFAAAEVVRHIRQDGAAVLAIFGLSAFCYGRHWPFFAAMLAARMFFVSFLDNLYHYGTPVGATASGHNVAMPAAVSRLILHFNLHRIHHRHPGVPWMDLPQVFAQSGDRFDRTLRAAAADQLRGPISLEAAAVERERDRRRQRFSPSAATGDF